jgi:hypothetical protein
VTSILYLVEVHTQNVEPYSRQAVSYSYSKHTHATQVGFVPTIYKSCFHVIGLKMSTNLLILLAGLRVMRLYSVRAQIKANFLVILQQSAIAAIVKTEDQNR